MRGRQTEGEYMKINFDWMARNSHCQTLIRVYAMRPYVSMGTGTSAMVWGAGSLFGWFVTAGVQERFKLPLRSNNKIATRAVRVSSSLLAHWLSLLLKLPSYLICLTHSQNPWDLEETRLSIKENKNVFLHPKNITTFLKRNRVMEVSFLTKLNTW